MQGRSLKSVASGLSLGGGGGGFVRVAAAGLISLGAAPAFGQTGAIGDLRETFPGVQVYERDGRVRTVYGRAMTQSETPREAADEWIFFHGEVFGSSLDLDEFGIHCRGELLSAIWLDIRDDLESAGTRTLFLDWMTIAQRPGSACDPALDQSADDGTLLEVLTVADDGDVDDICAAFLGRGIEHPDPRPNPCQESAGWLCYADCDGSGVLDFWDFLCFQNQFAAGDPGADCDGSGVLDLFDVLCFQNEFAAGCP